MKVLDVTEFYSELGGGIRTHLTLKQQMMVRSGVQHVVVAPAVRGSRHGEMRDPNGTGTSKVLRVRGHQSPFAPSYCFFSRPDRVSAVLNAECPDVVELHSPYSAAMGVFGSRWARHAIRTFFWHSDHVSAHLCRWCERAMSPQRSRALTDPVRKIYRPLSTHSDATIVTSRWQYDLLCRAGFPRVRHIPMGVRKEIFSLERAIPERRQELLAGAPPLAKLVIGIGRMSVEKQWEVALEAFERFREREDAVFVLFGDGPEHRRLETRFGDRPDIRFMGFDPDPARLAAAFASADVLLHGCCCETFGLGVAEAVSCGLPIVVPDAGGVRELAFGAAAERYVAGDAADAARSLERLLSRDPIARREAAVAAARRVRSAEAHFEDTLALYRELVEAQRQQDRPAHAPH